MIYYFVGHMSRSQSSNHQKRFHLKLPRCKFLFLETIKCLANTCFPSFSLIGTSEKSWIPVNDTHFGSWFISLEKINSKKMISVSLKKIQNIGYYISSSLLVSFKPEQVKGEVWWPLYGMNIRLFPLCTLDEILAKDMNIVVLYCLQRFS